MRSRSFLQRIASLALMLCLLPLSGLAQSGGPAESDDLAYGRALDMLIASSKTDVAKLEDISRLLKQAEGYEFGFEYLVFVEAMLLVQGTEVDGFDRAIDSIQRLSKINDFTRDYYSHLTRSGRPALPDLEKLARYIEARKTEAYGDRESAIVLYEQYPVLDAVDRAGELTNAIRMERYDRATALFTENSLLSVQQAADLFEKLGNYRDSQERLKDCQNKITELTPTLTPDSSPTPTLAPTRSPSPTQTSVPDNELARMIFYANFAGNFPIYFGRYEQDNDLNNGKEVIAWQILAIIEDKGLMVSEKSLDSKPYNNSGASVNWETCSLRKWLNNDFLYNAFNPDEQKIILNTKLENEDNEKYGTEGGQDTWDKVFLLSIKEVHELFETHGFIKTQNTEYAITQGAIDYNGQGWWWLRSPGQNVFNAAYVDLDGSMQTGGAFVAFKDGPIRPALWIDLSSVSSNMISGSKTITYCAASR